jgi:diacylglycerol kinase family enzyme
VGALLVVNPHASGVSESSLSAVRSALPRGTDERFTTRGGEATEIAREASGRVDALYVFSGDGTYNEVLNGIDRETLVGFIPGGGTSVIPRALGVPRDPVAAARFLATTARPRRITLGRANGRRFCASAGIGLDAETVRRVDRLGRAADGRRPGDAAFVRAALGAVGAHGWRFPPVLDITGVGRAALVLVANGSPYTYAGRRALNLVPGAEFELGLDFVAPHSIRRAQVARIAVAAARGRLDRTSGVFHGHDLDLIEVTCDRPLPLQVDGEDLGDVEHALVEAERGAVTVLA